MFTYDLGKFSKGFGYSQQDKMSARAASPKHSFSSCVRTTAVLAILPKEEAKAQVGTNLLCLLFFRIRISE